MDCFYSSSMNDAEFINYTLITFLLSGRMQPRQYYIVTTSNFYLQLYIFSFVSHFLLFQFLFLYFCFILKLQLFQPH